MHYDMVSPDFIARIFLINGVGNAAEGNETTAKIRQG